MNAIVPFLLLGLTGGSLYALAAMGLVLTYRTTGVFDIALGAVAMFSGYMFWQLAVEWGLPAWVSLLIIVCALAPTLGLIREWLYRQMSGIAIEVQLVASAAILVFFPALALIIYGPNTLSVPSVFPTASLSIAKGVYIGENQIITFAISAALAIALMIALRFSRLGLAAQAVVDNRNLAEMAGISSAAVARIVWIVSTAFAALVGVLLAQQQGLDTTSLIAIVSYSFFGAVLGRLTNLPLAYAGGLAIGLIQGILLKWSTSGVMAEIEASLPYLALFLTLIVYGPRLRAIEASSRRTPLDFSTNLRRGQRTLLLVGCGVAAVILPYTMSSASLIDFSDGFSYAIIAIGVVILIGWAGEVSLAQLSLAGIGAYTVAHLAGHNGSLYIPALLLAALIAGAISAVIGFLALRLHGVFLAVTTIALAYIFDNLIYSQIWLTNGQSGTSVPPFGLGPISVTSPTAQYYVVLIVLAAGLTFAATIRARPLGRRLRAMRDGPEALSTLGANLLVTKITVFVIAAVLAVVGGALYGSVNQEVAPSDFAFAASLGIVLFVVFVGRSLLTAAVVAGIFFAIQLLPIFSPIVAYIPLGISLGVMGLAQSPEGQVLIWRRSFGSLRRLMSAASRPAYRSISKPTYGSGMLNGRVGEEGLTRVETGRRQ